MNSLHYRLINIINQILLTIIVLSEGLFFGLKTSWNTNELQENNGVVLFFSKIKQFLYFPAGKQSWFAWLVSSLKVKTDWHFARTATRHFLVELVSSHSVTQCDWLSQIITRLAPFCYYSTVEDQVTPHLATFHASHVVRIRTEGRLVYKQTLRTHMNEDTEKKRIFIIILVSLNFIEKCNIGKVRNGYLSLVTVFLYQIDNFP